MPLPQSRPRFFDTEQGAEIEERLLALVADASFNTVSSYTPDAVKYPDNVMTFVDKHKLYIIAHPSIDANQYVDNLRLKTRLRR